MPTILSCVKKVRGTKWFATVLSVIAVGGCGVFMGSDVAHKGAEPLGYEQLNIGVPILLGASATGVQFGEGIGVTAAHNNIVIPNRLYRHKTHDIAFYRTEGPVPWWAQAKTGDKVIVYGNSILRQNRVLETTVINTKDLYLKETDDRLFATHEGFSAGMSGGPVYNEKEEVVGIVMGTITRNVPTSHPKHGIIEKGNGLFVPTTEIVKAFREMCPKTLGYAYPCALNPFAGDFQGEALDDYLESKIE